MNTNSSPNVINLLGLREKVILLHSKDTTNTAFGKTYGGYNVAMRAITEEEEVKLDKLSDKSEIYFYGEMNLNNEEDLKVIKNCNLVSQLGNSILYNNFNYDRGCFKLEKIAVSNNPEHERIDSVKWGPCLDPITWFKYQHCLLGKPARVIVYKGDFYEWWSGRRVSA